MHTCSRTFTYTQTYTYTHAHTKKHTHTHAHLNTITHILHTNTEETLQLVMNLSVYTLYSKRMGTRRGDMGGEEGEESAKLKVRGASS